MAARDHLLLYGNLNHSVLANTQLLATANETEATILAITEPYLRNDRVPDAGWTQFVEGRAALLFRPNLAAPARRVSCQLPNVVCSHYNGISILVAYFSPNVADAEFAAALSELAGFILSLQGPLLLCGDFNATTSLLAAQQTTSLG